MTARCEVPGCQAVASVHLMNPRRRVCAECAAEHMRCQVDECPGLAHVPAGAIPEDVLCDECSAALEAGNRPFALHRFPRAALMLEATAIAGVLRQAAIELEELAGSAPAYELGTFRRKVRAVILGACAFAEGSAGGES